MSSVRKTAAIASCLSESADPVNRRRLLERLRQGHVHNVAFADFRELLLALGFRRVRTSGSHEQFRHPRVPDVFTIQSHDGQAKPYQIRYILGLLRDYNLDLEDRP